MIEIETSACTIINVKTDDSPVQEVISGVP